jgi:two-component system, NarL family, sensor kinase
MKEMPVMRVLREAHPVRNLVLGWRRPGNSDLLWIYGNAIPQFDETRRMVRVITTFSDITDLKNAEKALHQLSTQLLQMQDQERRRIGRELHDGLAQTVLAVNLNLAQVRDSAALGERSERALEKARNLLQEMARDIRTLSYLLHPPLLDDLGLVSALKEYVHGFGERSGIQTDVVIDVGADRFPQEVETTFFRIVQESLANVQRHSGSDSARVILREDGNVVTLEISDEGCGMPVPVPGGVNGRNPVRLGVGIPGMRERMSQLGGTLEISSSAEGTTVRARLKQISGKRERTEDVTASDYHRG